MKKIIIKADGTRVIFDPKKVKNTCVRAGASHKLANRIAKKVSQQISNGTKTNEIYRMVLKRLQIEEGKAIKHRYRLKEAIMRMGPAGFPFESYVGEVLENYDYKILSTRITIRGKCVEHEIDLTAKDVTKNKRYIIECKYHNASGIYTGLKESLYTHARFLDLAKYFEKELLVCNTKISFDAITYANCVGQKVLSWRYPKEQGLEKMIEGKGLYPVTILGLNRNELLSLSRKKIMLAKDIAYGDITEISKKTGISHNRLEGLKNLAIEVISSPEKTRGFKPNIRMSQNS